MNRIRAVARHDLRVLRRDPAFLVIFTIAPHRLHGLQRGGRRRRAGRAVPRARRSTGPPTWCPAPPCLFSGFLVGNVGFGVFREHGWGTWERLRASPLTPSELMLGKSLVPILTISIQIAVLLGAGFLFFDLEVRGSMLAFALVAAALAVMNVAPRLHAAVGLPLGDPAQRGRHRRRHADRRARRALTPVEFLPGLGAGHRAVHARLLGDGGLPRGHASKPGGLADVAVPLLVLLGFTAAFAVIAVVRFQVEDTKISWA